MNIYDMISIFDTINYTDVGFEFEKLHGSVNGIDENAKYYYFDDIVYVVDDKNRVHEICIDYAQWSNGTIKYKWFINSVENGKLKLIDFKSNTPKTIKYKDLGIEFNRSVDTDDKYFYFYYKPQKTVHRYDFKTDTLGYWDNLSKIFIKSHRNLEWIESWFSEGINSALKLIDVDDLTISNKSNECIFVAQWKSIIPPNKTYVHFSDNTKTLIIENDDNLLARAVNAIYNYDGDRNKTTSEKLKAVGILTQNLPRTKTEEFEIREINKLISNGYKFKKE